MVISTMFVRQSEFGFKALSIEVINDALSNILCGVIYRYPNGNTNEFLDYFTFAVERTTSNRENKPYLIMGDFNLDILKYDSHFDTDNFLNIMLSNRFQPHVVQPTRITDHRPLSAIFSLIRLMNFFYC